MKIIYYWSKFIKKLRGSAVENSEIHKTSKIEAGSHIFNTIMDRHSFCGYDCEILHTDIGSFCSIANNVKIGGGFHPMEWVSMSPVFYEGRDSVRAKFSKHKRPPVKRTLIGHDVWIGQSAIIKQGVSIGIGAVVGMGSVVTKDIQPYSIVAGSPAKVIRMRFDSFTIEELLKSQWWLLKDHELAEFSKYFIEPNIFIKKYKI